MPGCEHNKTEFLMRRDGIDYMRCLGCDQVFEADDLELLQKDLLETDDDVSEGESPRQRRAS